MSVKIITGDCIERMNEIDSCSFHTCVTSPPYYRLRDYDVDGQIGLEESPAAYVQKIVEVMRAVRRVLRNDGTVWLNIGDSYANDRSWGGKTSGKHVRALHGNTGIGRRRTKTGLKSKNLMGMPWRVALALQEDGWYLRQDIIWSKPNPMTESVKDRCTKSHEYIFLLSKNEKYYFDHNAIQEPADPLNGRDTSVSRRDVPPGRVPDSGFVNGRRFETRNKRSVWTVTTCGFKGAHFATFPPKLIVDCILAGCPEGGTVLDPFGGAGTTGLVADRLNRNAVLIELNPKSVQLARDRLHEDQSLPLSGGVS